MFGLKKSSLIILFLLPLSLLYFYFYHYLHQDLTISSLRPLLQDLSSINSSSFNKFKTNVSQKFDTKSVNKTILFYTKFWSHLPRWGQNVDTYTIDQPASEKCPIVNCIFTHDKKYFKNFSDFDAVIFHRSLKQKWKHPRNRKPHQLFIMATRE